jgi:chemotaxis protein CheD
MSNKIEVTMGEGAVCRAPHIIASSGIGSCVAVALYDTKRSLGGLAHIMLPDSENRNGHRSYRYADTAIAALIKKLRAMGASQQYLVAKLVGGAKMFISGDDSSPGIGEQNVKSVKRILKQKKIVVIGESTGGSYGRNVEFHLDSGRVMVKAIGQEVKEI